MLETMKLVSLRRARRNLVTSSERKVMQHLAAASTRNRLEPELEPFVREHHPVRGPLICTAAHDEGARLASAAAQVVRFGVAVEAAVLPLKDIEAPNIRR